jgi:hypothetical protein
VSGIVGRVGVGLSLGVAGRGVARFRDARVPRTPVCERGALFL